MALKNRIFLLGLTLLVMSCDSGQIFDKYQKVPNRLWSKNEVIDFNITPPDSINPYNLFINIRNTNNYKFNNLFLVVQMRFPHGKSITDTLEYKMAEPSGKLLGTGLTAIKENKLWYKEHVVFKEQGLYKLSVQHAMRKNGAINGIDALEGVTDVGFRIEKVKN